MEENRILVTLDNDFGELIFAMGRANPGTLRLVDIRAADQAIRRSVSSSAGPPGLLGIMHPELRPPDATTRPQ